MNKSISEIKHEFEQADKEKLPLLYEQYARDSRTGVVSLIAKYKKKEEKLQAEIKRIEEMSRYEQENCMEDVETELEPDQARMLIEDRRRMRVSRMENR